MKLMTMKQYSKMTKVSLVKKIMKALKKMPKTKLAKLCYELEKRRLPTISTTKKGMPRLTARRAFTKPKRVSVRPIPRRLRPIGYMTERRMTQKANRRLRPKKPRSAKQRANDKRLGLMAKRRAKAKRRLR
tara:strand:+ start:477 stop:869 length:393 start_codon:yes stop_codon:yes gene_type:complete